MSFTRQTKSTWRFECMVKGKRFSKTYKSYEETKSEVQKKFLEWKIQCEKNMCVVQTYTFKEFAGIWINEYCKDYSPLVVQRYKTNLKNWIIPMLGGYKLTEITPFVLDKFIAELKDSTTKYETRENKQLSNGTIQKLYAIVRTIITTAFQKDLVANNPCLKVKLNLKKKLDEEVHYYDMTTYKKFLNLIEKELDDKARVIEFAVKTGLRRSEIFGLTWADIDFEKAELSVNKTLQKVSGKMCVMPCKTKASIRKISLPISMVSLLKEYRKKHMGNFYIFSNVDYDSVTQWFRKWQVTKGLPRIKFHDLRHTHATLLLYQGVDIKTISERLGHSGIGITMNTYTHVMKELDTKAAIAIDAI